MSISKPGTLGHKKGIKLSPAQMIALGFAGIILVGALLLMLPISNRGGGSIPFINALFTSVSATCVTGLSVYDTWTQFSGFGHVVLLMLIQVGGLGFMSIAVLFSLATGKRISLQQRMYISEAVSAEQLGGIVRLMKRVLLGTLVFELAGAALLAVRLCPELGFWRGVWYGIFHSVSAFCNAGFDLMGYLGHGSSLIPFADDWFFCGVIMLLVIVGGIGFAVWSDLYDNRLNWRKYSLHTKLVLTVTAVLLGVPAVVFFFTERNAAMAGMNVPERLLASMFQSVTLRTAGFYTIDNGELSPAGLLLSVVLMLIGGAPGSTAGGIKTTTVAVAALAVVCYIRGRADVNVFGRRLSSTLIRRAFCTIIFTISLAVFGTFLICAIQPLPMDQVLFEAFSAIGTAGITNGTTARLGAVPKLIIAALMFSGRVGNITLLLSAAEPRSVDKLRCPEGRVIVG